MKTVIILQARLDSTRLPRKALLKLEGEPLIVRAMRALSLVEADERVLATDEASAAELHTLARREGFKAFSGPKEDVLERYRMAASEFGAELVIRATGDNPLVSYELANLLLESRLSAGDPDYAAFMGMPVGMGVEIIRSDALSRAAASATDPFEREHVAPHLYRNPASFRIHRVEAPPEWRAPSARVTVDTAEDFAQVSRVFAFFGGAAPVAGLELMAWLRAEGLA